MEGIRIIKLPAAKMVSSGSEDLDSFNIWWSKVDKERKDQFFPRDFMSFDPRQNKLVWYYAVPEDVTDYGGFDVMAFPGGLYAASISKDMDDVDGERVFAGIKKWILEQGVFELDERPDHYTLFHVITPDEVFDVLGYRQLDMYVPIKIV